jgi:membrane dipeptidase
MKQGIGWLFRGDFDSPLRATDWSDLWSSRANRDSLDASGDSIVVVALYAHPILTGFSVRDSIRRQLDEADAFVAKNAGWILAREPADARRALAAGKKSLVLSLEGAWGALEDEADLAELVDRRGVRIVTLHHLTDDELGGAAFLPGVQGFSTPGAFFTQLFAPLRDPDGVRVNRNGLSERGEALTRKLLARKVWIDLTHAPDRSLERLVPMLRAAGQPVLHTHTVLRRFHGAERGISDRHLAEVGGSGGIVGLMPTERMLEGTPGTASCESGVLKLATQHARASEALGADAVMLGSDVNAPIPFLKPACGSGTSLDGEHGFWKMDQTSELWAALRRAGAPVPDPLSKQAEKFISAWEKIRSPK